MIAGSTKLDPAWRPIVDRCHPGGCRAKAPAYEGKTVAELEQMLRSSDPLAQGAFGLSLLGPGARDAAPALIEALKDPGPAVRRVAALAQGRIGPDAREVVPALTEALHDSEWPVRREAAMALGEFDPAAQSAIGPLQELRQDSDHLVRRAAQDALTKIRSRDR